MLRNADVEKIMENKTLSDKIIPADNRKKDNGFFWERDVREALQKLRTESLRLFGLHGFPKFDNLLKEIMGEKFTGVKA